MAAKTEPRREPAFIIPGLIWRFLKWIAPLAFAFAAFTMIVGFGYLLARLLITGWPDPGRSLETVFIFPAFLYAPLWVLGTRRRARTLRSYILIPTIVSALTFLLVLVLHFARPGPPRFEFLAGQAVTFDLDAPTPGYFEWAYTFRGDIRELGYEAEKELSEKGYRVDRRRGSGAFRIIDNRNSKFENPNTSLSLYPGRAVAKSFLVDGDILKIDPSPGWVTVDISQQDAYPLWLGLFIP